MNPVVLENMKAVLVEMAINCTLPSDMTQLDMDTIYNEAVEKSKNDPLYEQERMIIRLGDYISEDDVRQAYIGLVIASRSGNGDKPADNYVMMWEPFEYRYTVDQLLDEL